MVVHGANALRDKLAEALGQTKQVITSVKGYSSVYSDDKMIDLMMMSYAGVRNKRIVELCHRHGINAVGLSGLDGKAVQGVRNKGIRVYQDGKQKIVRDFSGKPESVNKALLDLLLEHGYVPVLTVPIVDEDNNAINTENDDVVRVLQHAVRAGTVINLIEAPGFLSDKDDEEVEGRMRRKMLAVRKLFEAGATRVIIADGRAEHPVDDALSGKGTVIS
jgi:acetylglutamate/LysW-gamma-L-alpha-aminoadipate kinase